MPQGKAAKTTVKLLKPAIITRITFKNGTSQTEKIDGIERLVITQAETIDIKLNVLRLVRDLLNV